MVTERIIIEDTSQIDLKKLEKAAAILREGGLVAFPTEMYMVSVPMPSMRKRQKRFMRPKEGLRIILLLCISADGRIFTGLRSP